MSDLVTAADTALWVAWQRAVETKRPDALFSDPLAGRLAGERGELVARRMNRGKSDAGAWTTVVRTRLIDDLVVRSLAEGADRVVNLAAGYDTRPYRLPLPPALRWVEVDGAPVLERKARLLEGERPACAVERAAADLADPAARASVLDRALEGSSRALVITEGLLVYLPPEAVSALATDLHARPAARFWITDLAPPLAKRMMRAAARGKVADDALWRFAPAEGAGFFEPLGWRPRDVQPMMREARRLGRLPWLMRLFAPFDRDPRRPWGAVLRCER
jgi:methyltransferase (TIGR00027 family)